MAEEKLEETLTRLVAESEAEGLTQAQVREVFERVLRAKEERR
jgi:hypothetical protein